MATRTRIRGILSKESSFSEDKEAKRLSPMAPAPGIQEGKGFWFFFSKKNLFLP
jgi:hypothetical protein